MLFAFIISPAHGLLIATLLVFIFGLLFLVLTHDYSTPSESAPLKDAILDKLAEHGWKSRMGGNDRFERNGFVLYLGSTNKSWVFDRFDIPKNGPGVLARFDTPLLIDDIQYMNEHINRTKDFEVRDTYSRARR